MKKVSVSKIVSVLYYNPFERPPDYVLQKSQLVHARLGFNNTTIYRRFFEYENELYEISGMPDRISEDGCVEELKSKGRKAIQVGETQANIYCWMTGLKKYRVYLSQNEKIVEIIEGSYSEDKALRDLSEGLRRLKIIESLYDG